MFKGLGEIREIDLKKKKMKILKILFIINTYVFLNV
jgi:hypothetical protein